MFRTLMVVLMVISVPAFAGKKDRDKDDEGGRGKACAPVKDACEKAGYTSGRKGGGAGSVRDCVQNWATGAQIKGIKLRVNDPALKDCLAHIKEKEKRRSKDDDAPAAVPGAVSGAVSGARPAVPPPPVAPGKPGAPPPAGAVKPPAHPTTPANAPAVLPANPPPPKKP